MYHVVSHPLLAHKLGSLRDRRTDTKEFRELAGEITMLLAYEALGNLETEEAPVETPLATARGVFVKENIVVVPILRAGVGMLDAMLRLIPRASIGFIGIYRDPESKLPVAYYEKLPPAIPPVRAVVVDPMLATGGSINAAITTLKGHGYERIKLLTIIAAPEGIRAVEEAHPDVEIFTGAVDDRLDEHKYIIPGLGDAGDRLFGTR
jgi:uracil phosphoribosyltransferase